jgi:antitoxin component of RelBE/YafQ-DinJ toxin-antitoxin module
MPRKKSDHILTGTQWAILNIVILRARIGLNLTSAENSVLAYIQSRSIAWMQLSFTYQHSEIFSPPKPIGMTPSLDLPRSSIFEAFNGLLNKNIILCSGERVTNGQELVLNLPAMLSSYIEFLDSLDGARTGAIETIQKIVSEVLSNMGFRWNDKLQTRKDEVARKKRVPFKLGDDTHQQTVKENKARLRVVKPRKLNTDRLEQLIKEKFEIPGVTRAFPFDTKSRGQAKNWLKECEKEGRNAEEIIKVVVEHWSNIVKYFLDELEPEYPFNPVDFFFEDFYTYRGHIYDWIKETSGGEDLPLNPQLVWRQMADRGEIVDISQESHRRPTTLTKKYIEDGGVVSPACR